MFPAEGRILGRGHWGRDFERVGTCPWPHGCLSPSYDWSDEEASPEWRSQDASWIPMDCLATWVPSLFSLVREKACSCFGVHLLQPGPGREVQRSVRRIWGRASRSGWRRTESKHIQNSFQRLSVLQRKIKEDSEPVIEGGEGARGHGRLLCGPGICDMNAELLQGYPRDSVVSKWNTWVVAMTLAASGGR